MRTITTRTIAGRVSAAGAIVTGNGFTVAKGAAGVYTITFTDPSFRLIAMSGSTSAGNTIFFPVSYPDTRTATTNTLTTGGTGTDTGFSFTAVGTA